MQYAVFSSKGLLAAECVLIWICVLQTHIDRFYTFCFLPPRVKATT